MSRLQLELYGFLTDAADYEILKRLTDMLANQMPASLPLVRARRLAFSLAKIALEGARSVRP